MTTRKRLLISVSTVALVLGAAAMAQADQEFTAHHTANSTAGGNVSDQTDKSNLNENVGNAFQNAVGVISELQNNGDNSALSNGNTVDATIATGNDTGNVIYTATSHQTASQTGDSTVTETNTDDDNVVTGNAFQNAEGVISKLQNNGAESAINNGNTVAAAILEGATGTTNLTATSIQLATVNGGGTGNSYFADPSSNDNDISSNAFQNTKGVVSAAQNNGPNAALNNGNTVSAVIAPGANVVGNATFLTPSLQNAAVNGNNSSTEIANTDTNRIRNQAFQNTQGVASVLQNNGANSAANNGNTVAAIVTDHSFGSNSNFNADVGSAQQAVVDTFAGGANTSTQTVGSNDSNSITNSAFEDAQGVFSAMQNNGPNSALNGGNTVSAIIADGSVNKPVTLDVLGGQVAEVTSDEGTNSGTEDDSTDSNTINANAFSDAEGVISATQNNGANSALNNGNSVAAVISGGGTDVDNPQTLDTESAQFATVESSGDGVNSNTETAGSDDTNLITNSAFNSAQGVISVLQNNGANTAANNGNTVSAVISAGSAGAGTDNFSAASTQTARVDANGLSGNFSQQLDSDNTNTLTSAAFQDVAGVVSVLQNNGANSALNNGNTVSAFVIFASGVGSAGSPSMLNALSSGQTAVVEANASLSGIPDGNQNLEGGIGNRVFDTNTMTANVFENAEGVVSALQNNGANSAINNGNTVAAVIADPDTGPGGGATANFDATSNQTALVTNDDGAGNNGGANRSVEARDADPLGNPDENTIGSSAFGSTKGVFSVGQNNGANSAINNGNTVAAIINDDNANTTAGDTLDASSLQSAIVESRFGSNPADGNQSEEANSPDSNAIASSAFENVQGVGSVVQNNGANSALNNGNTVAAIITDDQIGSRADFSAQGRQVARVSAFASTLNRDQQGNIAGFDGSKPSNESNAITDNAFNDAAGVFSVLQNNGPNSAVNNGNTVAAFIADGSAPTVALDAPSDLNANQAADMGNSQTATVEAGNAGSANHSRQQGSDDSNLINDNAFMNAAGVISALQNNGGNSALNNGNTVAAVIAENGISGDQPATFLANHDQIATVDAAAGTNLSEAGGFGTGGVDSDATNTLTNSVFSNAEGVFSVLQNNGANTAANNGNVVSAFIADGAVDVNTTNTFTANSDQTATVTAGAGLNSSIEADDSDDTNTITSSAFNSTQGIVSVMQNNGSNSALNGGNTVSAIINSCAACTGTFSFGTTSTQTQTVAAASAIHSADSDNVNTIGASAFSNVAGVYSVTQNNGPNSALSNGNTVSAVIVNN